MDKFRNKYRVSSARLKNWDYGSNAAYFITICTEGRTHFFGNITDGVMQLNALGQLAEQYWMEIPAQFPFVELGNFVVMPNHTHGILMVDKSNNVANQRDVETRLIASLPQRETTEPQRETTEPTINGGVTGKFNPMFHENISRIIRWYKGRCSYEMRKIRPDFAWQPRFHDHVIRDPDSFGRIQAYIENNPTNWIDDGRDAIHRVSTNNWIDDSRDAMNRVSTDCPRH